MKIIHIESGLGNQMLSYAEYLVMKKNNPADDCYIETIIYEIPECNDVICQWNGYELNRIFGIDVPNIKDIFNDIQWNNVLNEVRNSEFWNHNWNYPKAIVKALNSQGLNVINTRGDFENNNQASGKILKCILDNRLGYFVRRKLRPIYQKQYIEKNSTKDKIFVKSNDDLFAGQFLGLSHKNSGIEFVEKEIRNTFCFPELSDKKNIDLQNEIESCNSVSIHVRRGDMLSSNEYLYKYGYFKRAIRYIKKRVDKPCFYFFSDPGSLEWCKQNIKVFDLDLQKDNIKFVDWNKGNESYRDMQLMAKCKHNIITFSSFGWWGSYLNENPNKITISPNIWQNTTVTL